MLRRLPIPFSQFVSIMSFLVVTAACLDSDLFLLVKAEEEQKGYYLLHSISSLLFNNDVPDLYPGAAFVKELENLIKNFEYTFDVSGDQIFPNDTIKQNIVSKYEPSKFVIKNLRHQLFGLNITASDIMIHVSPKKMNITKTMVNVPCWQRTLESTMVPG